MPQCLESNAVKYFKVHVPCVLGEKRK